MGKKSIKNFIENYGHDIMPFNVPHEHVKKELLTMLERCKAAVKSGMICSVNDIGALTGALETVAESCCDYESPSVYVDIGKWDRLFQCDELDECLPRPL